MSALEEKINPSLNLPVKERTGPGPVTQFLKLLSSVRFGIFLLILLGLACTVGMVVMQQNVQGFENYYAQLTPAQKLVYGKLGLFDIYHVWYFNALLAVLSLNIVLSSFDRLPKTWKQFGKARVDAPVRWIREQKAADEIETEGAPDEVRGRVVAALEAHGFKKTQIKEKGRQSFVFAQKNVWNRFGAYPVHVGLLLIFLGGFLTSQFGNTGNMPLAPGQKSNMIYDLVTDLDQVNQVTKQIPFEVYCTDIQQKLIKNEGSINAMNTIDWLTKIRIVDGGQETEAVVQMNRPFDYRGYRFFQASFVAVGRARRITVRATPADGSAPQEVSIPRDGAAELADGTTLKFVEFRGNFTLGQEDPNEDTSSYPNPGAVLSVAPAGGASQTAYAFGEKMAGIPSASKPTAGYTYRLVDFEKVGDQHILSVQRDPGATVVYVGFAVLCLALVAVFFFSHQRIWAVVEDAGAGRSRIVAGGNTNRSQSQFDEKFQHFMNDLREQNREASV